MYGTSACRSHWRGTRGVAAAMLLSQRGIKTQVFEKANVIGGRSAEVVLGNYRFDLGPTFLMMKFLLDELFEEGGRRSRDYLDFRRLDPMYELRFSDKSFLARSRPEDMKAEIDRVFPGEGAGFDPAGRVRALVHVVLLPNLLLVESALGLLGDDRIRIHRKCSLHRGAAIQPSHFDEACK